MKTKEEMKQPLKKQVQKLKEYLNRDAKRFIDQKNL